MKTFLLLLFCIALCFVSFGQKNSSQELMRNEYLQKSKKSKIIGFSFLSTGVALVITGGIIDRVKQPELLAGFTYEFFGAVSTLISVPFLLRSSKYKSKAMMISINPQQNVMFKQSANFHSALSLKIQL